MFGAIELEKEVLENGSSIHVDSIVTHEEVKFICSSACIHFTSCWNELQNTHTHE